jgi:hypothetical protein
MQSRGVAITVIPRALTAGGPRCCARPAPGQHRSSQLRAALIAAESNRTSRPCGRDAIPSTVRSDPGGHPDDPTRALRQGWTRAQPPRRPRPKERTIPTDPSQDDLLVRIDHSANVSSGGGPEGGPGDGRSGPGFGQGSGQDSGQDSGHGDGQDGGHGLGLGFGQGAQGGTDGPDGAPGDHGTPGDTQGFGQGGGQGGSADDGRFGGDDDHRHGEDHHGFGDPSGSAGSSDHSLEHGDGQDGHHVDDHLDDHLDAHLQPVQHLTAEDPAADHGTPKHWDTVEDRVWP